LAARLGFGIAVQRVINVLARRRVGILILAIPLQWLVGLLVNLIVAEISAGVLVRIRVVKP